MASNGPQLGDLLSMGMTLALCVVVGFGLGWLGDLVTGTFPLIAMIGLALGVVAAAFYVVKIFKRYS
ncbi:MAG: AtpZ/AtpI family protein [Pseudonocardia sp.]|nr:AtpZ/AtpI family protein [Pseudonocardia sp.]